MEKNLPARPNLDHLRRQAKALLAALGARENKAVSTILEHLPMARNMTATQVLETRFRLADAQSAIARQSGFASWPYLARHVEQLRSMEGIWAFLRLETDGAEIPASTLQMSRLLIHGDRFRTESPEANYEGIFNINVEAQPHEIDIEFIEGPEAGNWNYGIFRLDGDQIEICLDLNGKPRPDKFGSSAGSGHAYEILKRISNSRPENVTGGTASPPVTAAVIQDTTRFEFIESKTIARLQGEWDAVKIIRDGQNLPPQMLRTGLRNATKNEVKIFFGGQKMIHALIKLDESTNPALVDYYNLDGMCKGAIQHGIFEWNGEDACFCMAAPGTPRPNDFTAPPGSGRTFSRWRPKK